MSPGTLTIIGTGIALAAISVGLFAWLRSDMKHGYTRLEDRLARVGSDMKSGHTRLEVRLLSVEKEQARNTGLLESLGFTARAEPKPSAADRLLRSLSPTRY